MTVPTADDSAINQKYCQDCGGVISRRAEICPLCGVRQFTASGKNKVTAALFGIFLGSFGVHKFYLGKPLQGIVYLIFCWTFIPAVVGFIEGLVYLSMSDQHFRQKYDYAEAGVSPARGSPVEQLPLSTVAVRAAVALTVLGGLAYLMKNPQAPRQAPPSAPLQSTASVVYATTSPTPSPPLLQLALAQRPAPDSFRGIAWDSALPSIQKLRETVLKGCAAVVEQKNFTDTPPCSHMHILTDDMDLFSQRRNVPPIYGVSASEQLIEWSHRKFWSGIVYIHDYTDADFAKLRAALIDQFGQPTFANEQLHLSKWSWPDKKLEISLYADPIAKPSLGSNAPPQTTLTLTFGKTE